MVKIEGENVWKKGKVGKKGNGHYNLSLLVSIISKSNICK